MQKIINPRYRAGHVTSKLIKTHHQQAEIN